MRPDPRFRGLDKGFWAYIRSISERVGYTDRRNGEIKIYTMDEILTALRALGLSTALIYRDGQESPTPLGTMIVDYVSYRAHMLNDQVQSLLMNAAEAEALYLSWRDRLHPRIPTPMNKQRGDKAKPAYLTGLVNMFVEAGCGDIPCDYDPKRLSIFTRDTTILRTMARRFDGCFPSVVNPIAVWEIKEYYYTTTFGSRVADGVYETLLDGLELEELQGSEGIQVDHLLIADGHYTWWECGRSYLCRIIDMLNMGYVDEVLFGREVVGRLPDIVQQWARRHADAAR